MSDIHQQRRPKMLALAALLWSTSHEGAHALLPKKDEWGVGYDAVTGQRVLFRKPPAALPALARAQAPPAFHGPGQQVVPARNDPMVMNQNQPLWNNMLEWNPFREEKKLFEFSPQNQLQQQPQANVVHQNAPGGGIPSHELQQLQFARKTAPVSCVNHINPLVKMKMLFTQEEDRKVCDSYEIGGNGHRYQLHKEIGSGSFGVVHAGIRKVDSFFNGAAQEQNVAVKVIQPLNPTKNIGLSYGDAQKEIQALQDIQCHPNVVNMKDWGISEANEIVVVMGMAGKLSLEEWFAKENGRLFHPDMKVREKFWYELRDILGQIFAGLAHIHGKNYAHRDLKPANIMLSYIDHPNSGLRVYTVKIIDLGLAKKEDGSGFFFECVGTPMFFAPGVVEACERNYNADRTRLVSTPVKTYTKESYDMWCVGFIMYFFFTGKFPFDLNQSLPDWEREHRIKNYPLKFPPGMVPRHAKDLITLLLRRNPSYRLQPGVVLMEDPFFKEKTLELDARENIPGFVKLTDSIQQLKQFDFRLL